MGSLTIFLPSPSSETSSPAYRQGCEAWVRHWISVPHPENLIWVHLSLYLWPSFSMNSTAWTETKPIAKFTYALLVYNHLLFLSPENCSTDTFFVKQNRHCRRTWATNLPITFQMVKPSHWYFHESCFWSSVLIFFFFMKKVCVSFICSPRKIYCLRHCSVLNTVCPLQNTGRI